LHGLILWLFAAILRTQTETKSPSAAKSTRHSKRLAFKKSAVNVCHMNVIGRV
jgi:hypothetical protein